MPHLDTPIHTRPYAIAAIYAPLCPYPHALPLYATL